jgi:transcriptional regulator with GAF, ATPase, and Fis domain
MAPRLVAIVGPLDGSTFLVAPGQLTIGRAPGNTVSIPDTSVSRNHCVVESAGDRIELHDLGSHNRTFVNDLPVSDHVLSHGDEVRIGCSTFLFFTDDNQAGDEVRLPDDAPSIDRTVVLRREDALYLDPQKAVGPVVRNDRSARSLECLLEVATIISTQRQLSALADRLLQVVTEAIPAQVVSILLPTRTDTDAEYLQFRRAHTITETVPDRLPSTIIRRVLSEQVSISSNTVQGDTMSLGESIIGLQVQSVLAVPLVVRETAIGVIYAANHHGHREFDEHHLQVLTGIAGLAAGALDAARHLQEVEAQNTRLQAKINLASNIIGESAAIRNVHKFIAKAAPTGSTVLVSGESGTGKELVARAIHRHSKRSGGPFVAINCAAITETLLESELFGHEKGAFTGAIVQKRGKLEEAHGGTLFLDEIGELAPVLQAKLLRVLQEREFERVGGTRSIKVDIRLIAATNRDLAEMSRAGEFRQDLYYRLNVVTLDMPPLRERREDLPLLAHYFVQKHAESAGRRVTGLSQEAIDCLRRYDWPGNVRELGNVIERALVLGSTELIQVEDLPDTLQETSPSEGGSSCGFTEMVNEAKKRIVLDALQQTSGNYSEAARLLRIHPNNLHRLIRNLNLKPALRRQ